MLLGRNGGVTWLVFVSSILLRLLYLTLSSLSMSALGY